MRRKVILSRILIVILTIASVLTLVSCNLNRTNDFTHSSSHSYENSTSDINGNQNHETKVLETEDPITVYKKKIHNRLESDIISVYNTDGISPGGMFFMSFSEATERFVKGGIATFYSCEEALKSGALSNMEKNSLLSELKNISEDNMVVYQLKGRVMQNPDLEYLLTDDITVLRIVLIYDKNAEFINYSILEVNKNLQTCVTLTVTRF